MQNKKTLINRIKEIIEPYSDLWYDRKLDRENFLKAHESRRIYDSLPSFSKQGELENLNIELSKNYSNYYAASACSMNEVYNSIILDSESQYYRRGIVIMNKGVPLGHVKYKGDRTFLAWRTIFDEKKVPKIIMGGIYSLHLDHVDILKSEQVLDDEDWDYIGVDKLKLYLIRVINEKSADLPIRKTFRSAIRNERTYVENKISPLAGI